MAGGSFPEIPRDSPRLPEITRDSSPDRGRRRAARPLPAISGNLGLISGNLGQAEAVRPLPDTIPVKKDEREALLSTPVGLLFHELVHSPEGLVRALDSPRFLEIPRDSPEITSSCTRGAGAGRCRRGGPPRHDSA